jgi:hypothetical protein
LKRGRTLEEGGTFKVERTATSGVGDEYGSPLLNLNEAKQKDRNQNYAERYPGVIADQAQGNDQQKEPDEGDNPRRD